MSIPTPPEPKPTSGPLERVEQSERKTEGERFSHLTPEGYRVYVGPDGRMRVDRPLRDMWIWS